MARRLTKDGVKALLGALLVIGAISGCSNGMGFGSQARDFVGIQHPEAGVMPQSLYVWATPEELESILAEFDGRVFFDHGDFYHLTFSRIQSNEQLDEYKAIIESRGFRVTFIPIAQLFDGASDLTDE